MEQRANLNLIDEKITLDFQSRVIFGKTIILA
jgi:hypothetical protein